MATNVARYKATNYFICGQSVSVSFVGGKSSYILRICKILFTFSLL